MNRGQVAIVVTLAFVAGAAGYFLSRQTTAPARPTVPAETIAIATPGAPQPAPEFSLVDVTGEPRAGSEWSGQVRLVNFWATWCPPCRREIPLLIDLQEEYGHRIRVIGIAIDDLDAVQSYAEEAGFNYPVLVGQQDAIDLGNAFLADFVGLPFTVLVDRDDQIARIHVGELHREQVGEFLSGAL